ncbi:hypothetical protein ACFR99_04540 [Haloarchaeobius amylolyticus]|uniref:CARDB domain-containing protein n=1 Tax=Haloarchaeobius amylolyticus TaxID=1198296 RepID=A0ABD6BD26_9EURY
MDGTDPDRSHLGRRSYLFGALGVGSLVAGRRYGGKDETITGQTGHNAETPAALAESEGTTTADQDRGEDDTTADQTESTGAESLRITSTNGPVVGGDLLEVAAEIENTGETEIRPAIDYVVDGEQRVTITTTVAPGETKPLDPGSYRTYPGAQPDTVTVRFETATAVAERTVNVRAVDELAAAQTTPAREITVQPDTDVLFDIESDALGAYGGRTHWFVDETYEGHSLGPWHTAYYSHQGAEYWRHTFESPGTYEVAAAVDGDETNHRATWTVHVSPTGTPAPAIDGKRPAADSLSVSRDAARDLELAVTHPNGRLDRVIWWLGHADRIPGVSDVSGAADTAALSLDSGCHGCPIIAWVIGTDGTITEEQMWLIDERTSA